MRQSLERLVLSVICQLAIVILIALFLPAGTIIQFIVQDHESYCIILIPLEIQIRLPRPPAEVLQTTVFEFENCEKEAMEKSRDDPKSFIQQQFTGKNNK